MNRSRRGFTLIELVVAAGVFALLAALTVGGFRSAREAGELRDAAEELARAIRDVENRGLTGTPTMLCADGKFAGLVCATADECGGVCASAYPSGGWGVQFTTKESVLTIFVDTDRDGFFTPALPGGLGELVSSVNYAPGGRVFVLKFSATDATGALASITTPPGAGGPVFNADGKIPSLTITLGHTGSNETKSIIVNRLSGIVDIQ